MQTENETAVFSIKENEKLCEAEHLDVQLPDVSNESAQNNSLENKPAMSSIQENDNLCEAKHSNIQLSDNGNEAAQNNKNLYPCNICQKVFIHPSGLNRHLIAHNNERKYACDLCNKTFKYVDKLAQHRRIIHSGKWPYVCHICKKGFLTPKILSDHILRHTTPKYYACKFCKEVFSCKDDLLHHRTVHTEIFPYVCKHCKKGYSIVRQLKNHNCPHKKEFRFTCETCNKGFNFGASFRRHLITHTGERPYTCNICNKPCPSVAGLKLHSQLHIRRPHLCTICKSCFKNQNSLDNHLQLHSGVHPYACKYCDKTFTGNVMLLKHYSGHIQKSLDKPKKKDYVCNICSITFDLKKNLLTHRHLCTGKKTFTCDVCSQNFISEKRFNSHAKTHSIDCPHVCIICSTSFTAYNSLKRHLSKHAAIDAFRMKQKNKTNENPVGRYNDIWLLNNSFNSLTNDLSSMPLSSVKNCDQLDLQKISIKPTNGVLYVLSSDSKVINNKILLNKEIKIAGQSQMMNQNNLMVKKILMPVQLASVLNNNHQVFNQSVMPQSKCLKPTGILATVSIPTSLQDPPTDNRQVMTRTSLLAKRLLKPDQLASVSNNKHQVFDQSVLRQNICLKPASILTADSIPTSLPDPPSDTQQNTNRISLLEKKLLKPDPSVSNNNRQVSNQSVRPQSKCLKPASVLTTVSIPASSPDLSTSNRQITNRISLLGEKILKSDQLASVSNNNSQVFNQSVLLQSKCLKPAGILATEPASSQDPPAGNQQTMNWTSLSSKVSNMPVSPKSDSSNSAKFFCSADIDNEVFNHSSGQQSPIFQPDKKISREIDLSVISKPADEHPFAHKNFPKGFDHLSTSTDYLEKQTDKQLKSASKLVQNISDILKKDSGSTDHIKLPSPAALNQNQDNEISQKSCVQSEEECFVNKIDSCDTDHTKSPSAAALNQNQPYEVCQKSPTSTSFKLLKPLNITKNNNVCDIRNTSNSTLKRILVPCSNKYPFICGICKKGFFQLGYLAAHSKTHATVLAKTQTPSVIEPKMCNFCKKTFTCLNSLAKHLLIHNTDYPLVSAIKDSPANSRKNFNIHQTAKYNKKYICKNCNKNFRDNLSLKTHNCQKSQKHELCKKSFIQFIQELKISKIASSKFNNFCEVCNKSFSSIPILERHSLVHIRKRRLLARKWVRPPYKLKFH